MTSRSSNDVAYTISAKDRASPVMAKVGKNLGRMQSSVVSMTGSLGALSSATTGVLGPMGGLIGSFGAAGVVVTGLGLGLSFAINKFKAMREEQKKTQQATESLRNRLMLSGFSADSATSAVDRMRSSLGRLAFQALPGLDFEMQGFIVNMDAATRTRFDEHVQTLIDLGVPAAQSLSAIGEAVRGNFGPISELLKRPITSFQQFAEEMRTTADQTAIAGDKVLQTLRDLGSGAISLEEGIEQLKFAGNRAFNEFRQTFEDNVPLIQRLLSDLTDSEFQYVLDEIEAFKQSKDSIVAFRGTYKLAIDDIIADLKRGREAEIDHTTLLRREIDNQIKEIERVAPVAAAEFTTLAQEYSKNEGALRTMSGIIASEIGRIISDFGSLAVGAEVSAARLEAAANRAAAAMARIRMVQTGPPRGPVRAPARVPEGLMTGGLEIGGGRGIGGFQLQHGAIVTRPIIARIGEVPEIVAPLSRLESLGLGGQRPINIDITLTLDGYVLGRFVINTLNDEVSLREPSLGLG